MDQSVSLAQFVNCRLHEIAEFTDKLQSKFLNCNKQPYQLLHKHLRRRPMSHNRYRIPSSLRKQMNVVALKNCEDSQRIIRCRKHIRKSKLLLHLYNRRSSKAQWMETHLHQARRMKMVPHFNYKVAYQANEKNFRAVHRYEDHATCIFDTSYYLALQLHSQHAHPFLSQYTDAKLPLNPSLYQEVSIRSIGYSILLHKPDQQQLLLLIHPGMLHDIRSLLNMLQIPVIIRRNELCLFQMFGPTSYFYIQDLLRKWNYNFELEANRNNFYYSVELQKEQKVQTYTRQDYKMIKSLDDYPDILNLNVSVKQESHQADVDLSIWDSIPDQEAKDKELMKRFKVVNRSRYTHRRKDKLKFQKNLKEQKELEKQKRKEKSGKKKGKEEKEEQPKKEKEKQNEKEGDDSNEKKAIKWILRQKSKFIQMNQLEEPMQLQENKKDQSEKIHIIIMTPLVKCKTSIGLSYKIIVNLGQGQYIWKQCSQYSYTQRQFYQMKVKPIGLRDVKQIALENQVRYFPDDFPWTNAAKLQASDQIVEKIEREVRLPPAKRYNHWLVRFPYPIEFPFKEYDVPCFILAMKSVPQPDALILKPREDDYEKDETKIEVEKNGEAMLKNDRKNKEEFQKYLEELRRVECSREIIGRVTYGNNSLKAGRGIGCGVMQRKFRGVESEFLVLFQNVGSGYLFFASCRVVSD